MNDLLTTTGMIATLVAVFFAIAGLYVSYRRRPAEAAVTTTIAPVQSTNVPERESVTRGQRETVPASRLSPAPSESAVAEVREENPIWAHSAFSTGQTGSPLFERLGSGKRKVATEPAPIVTSSSPYSWD